MFTGHKKAVSYVKFLTNDELASASTDSTLRLWDVKENLPVSNNMLLIRISLRLCLRHNMSKLASRLHSH